ncbi:MAG TPA: hypothetical protein DDW93_07830, partial [Firmicutes bacterium]|nr:hypothetical protein [Bacillota bacterium]
MLSKSPFERLQQLNDEFEIWWDASPLAYAPWKEKFLAGIEDTKKEKFAGWLDKLYNDKHPEKSVFL